MFLILSYLHHLLVQPVLCISNFLGCQDNEYDARVGLSWCDTVASILRIRKRGESTVRLPVPSVFRSTSIKLVMYAAISDFRRNIPDERRIRRADLQW